MTTRRLPSNSSRRPSSSPQLPESTRPRLPGPLISLGQTYYHTEPDPANLSSELCETLRPEISRQPSLQSFNQPKPNTDQIVIGTGFGQLIGKTWHHSWASVQGFANSLLSTSVESAPLSKPDLLDQPKDCSSQTKNMDCLQTTIKKDKPNDSWGPAPPSQKLGLGDVAAGSIVERQVARNAAKTASILENHNGTEGSMNIAGIYKRRNSDEIVPESARNEQYLVYIHEVQLTDTYAGLILRYKCREEAFRKANGLWSRDSIHIRKWLTIPVDACDVRGRPCDVPAQTILSHSANTLPSTPVAAKPSLALVDQDHFGNQKTDNGFDKRAEGEIKPWTHVRWVMIDSFVEPVEIGRVGRQAMGYFPPRRKRSTMTISPLSTPRHSSDVSVDVSGSREGLTPRQHSLQHNRWGLQDGPKSNQSKTRSEAGEGTAIRPAWMRGPGGVGSMNGNVRVPGPEKDYFNSWTRKHLPSLNMEELPSMSVMVSDSAHFGFQQESIRLIESSFEEGRDASTATCRANGLDNAASAFESWLRGALAKRPSTPLITNRSRQGGLFGEQVDSDLIELVDAASDDGPLPFENAIKVGSATSTITTTRLNSSNAKARVRDGDGAKGNKSE